MSDSPETDSAHPERIEGICGRFEQERNDALKALHQCYAATGEDAGDIGDFRALVDRERHTVNAVREMRKECDQWRECADALAFALRVALSDKQTILNWRAFADDGLAEFERLNGGPR